jgi:hypothetical protein
MMQAFRIERTHEGQTAYFLPMVIAVIVPGEENFDYRADEGDCDAGRIYRASPASIALMQELTGNFQSRTACVCEHMGSLIAKPDEPGQDSSQTNTEDVEKKTPIEGSCA